MSTVIDVSKLKSADRVRTVEGAIAEVIKPSEDGQWIMVRYLTGADDAPELAGTEDLCSREDVAEILDA